MFSLLANPTRTFVAQRGSRSIVTLSREATKTAAAAPAKTPASSTAAAISTTAAPAAPIKHVVENGRVTSLNRTYHSTSSWEVRDVPSNVQSKSYTARAASEERRRLARTRNAMECL